jgi:nucleoside-diphosphate-sugar epimerase
MRVLVTGNLGYVGAVLGRQFALRHPNWDLVGCDTGFFQDCGNGYDVATCYSRQIVADIRGLSACELEGIDAIVHLAGISNDPMGTAFESATMSINADGSANLGIVARRAGVRRFVFASSCSVYGSGGQGPRCERDPVEPLTAYAVSKVVAEAKLAELADSNFIVTNLRFATACGPSRCLRLDLVLNDFVASAVQSERIEVLSDGKHWRPLIHTEDMVRAIEWALTRDGDDLVQVNVGSEGWTWPVGRLAQNVASVLGGIEVTINQAAAPDRRSYQMDFSLFRRMASEHQPTKDFEQTVHELRDQIRGLSFGNRSFRESRYIRLNHLRNLRKLGMVDSLLRLPAGPVVSREAQFDLQ